MVTRHTVPSWAINVPGGCFVMTRFVLQPSFAPPSTRTPLSVRTTRAGAGPHANAAPSRMTIRHVRHLLTRSLFLCQYMGVQGHLRFLADLLVLCLSATAMSGQSAPERAIFGHWRVSASRCPTECAVGAAEARAWFGRQVVYGDSLVRAGGSSCADPRYGIGYWPANGRYGGARLSDFGIRADSAMVVDVRCPSRTRRGSADPRWPVWGAFVVVKDRDHLFVIWESRWFALTREDPTERSVLPVMQSPQSPASWTEQFPPFRIMGNLYYVGSRGLANYLITTPQGHILINSDLEANVPLIRASIEQLGFKFEDVKILLISHAHWDHDAGSARVKALTGAKYMVMAADIPVVESGGRTDFQYGSDPSQWYAPAHVDRALHDGDEVKLGDAVLVAHLTPGHTKGCTTWTLTVRDGAKSYSAVIIGSPNVNPGYKLVDNAAYPTIAQDYEKGFRVLKSLNCQIFLGAHGGYFDLEAKYARFQAGHADAFVDPAGCAAFVSQKEHEFRTALAAQTAARARSNQR